jgi:hypothetical protein
VRSLLFSELRLPDDPPPEPAQVISELRLHGTDITIQALAALPLVVTLSDEVEAERARQHPDQ